MRTIIAVLMIAASLATVASADEFTEPFSPLWGWHPQKVVGNVKRITETRNRLDGPGDQTKELPDGVLNTFDDKGRITEQALLAPSDGKPYPPATVKFDDKGRRTEILFRSFAGDISGSQVLTWNADGLGGKLVINDLQDKNFAGPSGDLTFDAKGRISRIKYNQAAGGSHYLFYTYSPDGDVDSILNSSKPDPAEAITKITYTYNDKGMIAAEEHQSRGKIKFNIATGAYISEWAAPMERIEHKYEYDSAGNWVKRVSAFKHIAPNAISIDYYQTVRTIEYVSQ